MTEATPTLGHRGERPYVGIPIEATLAEWREVNALVGEVFRWLDRRNEGLAGAGYSRLDHLAGGDGAASGGKP